MLNLRPNVCPVYSGGNPPFYTVRGLWPGESVHGQKVPLAHDVGHVCPKFASGAEWMAGRREKNDINRPFSAQIILAERGMCR